MFKIKLMNIKFLSFLGILFLFPMGCAKLQHMDELLTLKGIADEQKRQARYVQEQDQRFEKLRAVVQSGQIKKFSNQKQIASKFGQPIYTKTIEKDSQTLELWIYRYSVKYFDSDKVYLYFDQEGKLVDSVYEEPSAPTPQKTSVNSSHP